MARDNLRWPPIPEQLHDKKTDSLYNIGRLLGEGGFAKCYLATTPSGTRLACKVVLKESLKSEKHREKLKSEIKINDKLRHDHIVRFHSCFQDTCYVYIMLELCENQSLVDLLKARKRLTEDETRYYLSQMLDAMEYCHRSKVIHRDLKLGNVFLDAKMHIKIGDFGLATELASDDERKKTICGTPNYIAPEVLYNSNNGHDYKADIWSLGVILYTLVIGTPPFQTRETTEIYRKIRTANFQFPAHIEVTNEFKECVRFILTTDPKDRPTIRQIRQHQFFRRYTPKVMPTSALKSLPDFSTQINEHNLALAMSNMDNKQQQLLKSSPEQQRQFNQVASPQRKPIPATMIPDASKPKPIVTSPINPERKRKPFNYHITPNKNPVLDPISPTRVSGSTFERINFLALPDMTNYSILQIIHFNIKQAFDYIRKFKTLEDLDRITTCSLQVPVFINKWIDHGEKYGLGYQLTDETAGVFFKDSTTLVRNPAEPKLQYLYYKSGSTRSSITKESYAPNEFPEALSKKKKLFEHYRDYMRDHLCSSVATVPYAGPESCVFLTKFVRTHHAVMFRLSSKTVQVNFFDHYKLVISEEGRAVTLVDTAGKTRTLKMAEIISAHYKVPGPKATPETEDIYSRLKYVQDMLDHILKKKQLETTN